jgi:hypothetical protein
MNSAIPFAMKRAAVDVEKHSVGEETDAKKQRKGNEKLPARSVRADPPEVIQETNRKTGRIFSS